MADNTAYDLDSLRARIPQDRSEVFIGFSFWSEDAQAWLLGQRKALPESPGRTVRRTTWNNPDTKDERVLIDVTECDSAEEAAAALTERLEWNQLAELPESAEQFGDVAFRHPAGMPPALFFLRGNLCISVVSFGKEPVEIDPWAQRLNKRLDDKPDNARLVLTLRAQHTTIRTGQRIDIDYDLPWQYGEEGYLKFFSSGGTLAKSDKRLVLAAAKPGQANIDAYLLEPNREPQSGRFTLSVE